MARGKGRPCNSIIRKNLVDILFIIKEGYGYQLHKIYNEIFSKCTNEVIYYHLKKGVSLGEFKIKEIKIESGDFSWGTNSRKIIYSLGENANPELNIEIKTHMQNQEN